MKMIKLKLQDDEKALINSILLENCMGMTDVLREQNTDEGREQVMQVIQIAISTNHVFFKACLEKECEIPQSMAEFMKPILEGSFENLNTLKTKLIKDGHPNGFQIASTVEILGNIIKKIPNPSLIATI